MEIMSDGVWELKDWRRGKMGFGGDGFETIHFSSEG